MAFSITLLSWSVIEFELDLEDLGELENARQAIRWGTDYILKAHSAPNELYVQVHWFGTDANCFWLFASPFGGGSRCAWL